MILIFSNICLSQPETIIEISLGNINRTKLSRKPDVTLPKDYHLLVGKILEKAKSQLFTCFGSSGEVSFENLIKLDISENGKANSNFDQNKNSKIEDCVTEVLAKLEFPEHSLNKSVKVKFPIYFTKEVL